MQLLNYPITWQLILLSSLCTPSIQGGSTYRQCTALDKEVREKKRIILKIKKGKTCDLHTVSIFLLLEELIIHWDYLLL